MARFQVTYDVVLDCPTCEQRFVAKHFEAGQKQLALDYAYLADKEPQICPDCQSPGCFVLLRTNTNRRLGDYNYGPIVQKLS